MRKLPNILILILLFVLSGCYSCKSYHSFWRTGPVAPEVSEKFFWDKSCRPIAKKPAPAWVGPKPATMSKCGTSTVLRSYPCKDCSIVQLDKIMPSEVPLNTPFDYTIKVTNLTDMTVADVVVTDNIASNFSVKETDPTMVKIEDKLVWKLGTFAPKQSKLITVSGIATSTDCVKTCATVAYIVPACAEVQVVQPKLQLVKTAPSEVLLCDSIPVKFVVTNSGTGSTQNVKIEDTLPVGLRTSEGQVKITFDAGTLAAGQSRQFSATLMADKTGKYVNKAVASSAIGLKAESETTTIVRQPVLTISKTGPEKQYLGRSVVYEITVNNKGDAPASSLVVKDQLPSGVRFVSATNGGRASAGKVQWNLGTLMPGHSRKVSMTVMPDEVGTLLNTVSATATCAESARASMQTAVVGISAVLLEVIDIDDPVEVGGQTTYVITATNQGSAPSRNVSIVCTLEENEQYISSSGVTKGTVKDNTITFDPVYSLPPKAKATWRVVVKAVKVGDVRFKATMKTDQITRPVEETEATHLYE